MAAVHRSVTAHSRNWKSLADWPPQVINLAPFLILIAALSKQVRNLDLLLLLGVSLLMNYVLKNELKLVFGRDWPITWQGNIHSWINDRSYGFHFFPNAVKVSAEATSCFPSDHAAIAFATFLPFGFIYRKALPWSLLAAGSESVLMVVLNYHFLSDVLAGALLGISCVIPAATVLRVSETSGRPKISG